MRALLDVARLPVRVYRKAASGYRRQAAVLREASDLAVGDTVNCYVRLVEKSSGRLTVSRERVDTGSLRKERVAARLRKQIKRGTLAPGKQRVATVINYVGDFLQVDAGGILADIDAPDEEDFSEGDRIMVRIESVDEQALTATLSVSSRACSAFRTASELYSTGARHQGGFETTAAAMRRRAASSATRVHSG